MSNRRRLPGARNRVCCASCGKGIGKLADRIPLPDGRTVCGGCRDAGILARRLACGHYATAGNTVVRSGDGFTCRTCGGASLAQLSPQGRK